ncbi:MAG TPA: nitronate monooxygenase [Acidimicrobiales bacterium]|nr:nitronate monooxygenase [Acidimicrobiales bacterium]
MHETAAHIRTRMTEAWAIDHPVMSAGMGHLAVPRLVAAVSAAGGLGVLATSTLTPDEVRDSIREVRGLTNAPFGANILMRSDHASAIASVVVDECVPVVNLALGIDADLVAAVHRYGGKVVSTVTTLRHAHKAEACGADALIATGHEAGGHGGDLSTMVLVPLLVHHVAVPVIAAGGFSDGAGLAAALMLGAEGISMGSRFALSAESPIHPRVRELLSAAGASDTIVTDQIDGLPSRVLRTELSLAIAASSGYGAGNAEGKVSPGRDTFAALRRGDLDRGVVAIGQVVGAIHDTLTCAEIIQRTVSDARELIASRAGAFIQPI